MNKKLKRLNIFLAGAACCVSLGFGLATAGAYTVYGNVSSRAATYAPSSIFTRSGGVTVTADVVAPLILFVFVKAFGSGNSKISVFQLYLYFIFLKSRKIYIQFISFICFTYIGFHDIFGMFAIKRILTTKEVVSESKIIHPVIK